MGRQAYIHARIKESLSIYLSFQCSQQSEAVTLLLADMRV